MPDIQTIPAETMAALAEFDTCTTSNAIERFNVRLRNEGFMNASVRCQFPQLKTKAGYAATGRIRTSATPMSKPCYYEAMDWWSYVATIPAPRFVVLEDIDAVPGVGAFIGEVHANIAAALGCVAHVTNGAVRDLLGVAATGLQIFSGSVAVSHAYAHVVEFGDPVELGGLLVKPGDILQGDKHGVQMIPPSIASDLPQATRELIRYEKSLIEFCQSERFSLEELSKRIEGRA